MLAHLKSVTYLRTNRHVPLNALSDVLIPGLAATLQSMVWGLLGSRGARAHREPQDLRGSSKASQDQLQMDSKGEMACFAEGNEMHIPDFCVDIKC